DWPGCYGETNPIAAAAPITQAEAQQPTGPVTEQKAWIEMIHRYLAGTVGALCLVLAVVSTLARRELPFSLAWPWATFGWIIVQGLFGKYTVTLKLYPAIVTLHLAGGLILLALLVLHP
ncbi:COX15/CtaA family protein, partial [Salmonella enterica]|uniref:COX15/CtaA family protein n=1 Tax=Salmonella enterica TaxID=28901 RepID=UPI003FA72F6F